MKNSEKSINSSIMRILRKYSTPEHLHNQGIENVLFSPEMKNERLRRFLEVKRQDVIDVVGKYLLEGLKEGKTQQTVFGVNSEKLEFYMKNGWKIERFSKGLSLDSINYSENGQIGYEKLGELR